MEKKNTISKKDEALLRRFYGDEWGSHVDELMTTFDYSEAATTARKENFEGLSLGERLKRIFSEDDVEWRPNIERAEELIDFPLILALSDSKSAKKFFDFVNLLQAILFNTENNPTSWHLDKEEIETEEGKEKCWIIKDEEGNNVTKMAYPDLGKALAFFLLEWPHDIEPWLDYAGMFMYDGVNGKDLRDI